MERHATWLLLIVSLPTQSATGRMRVWRGLKAMGCAALRDGVYLVPSSEEREQALQGLAEECEREGGSAWLMIVMPRSREESEAYEQLFNRSADYAELRTAWKQAYKTLSTLSTAELGRLRRRLQREFEALRAVDFFPGEALLQADAAWSDFNRRLNEVSSPGEPVASVGDISRLDVSKYQGRLWATRRRPWVDRIASAWLIRRFIDRAARFRWLASPLDCPKSALGFDFDGAAFTHVGDRVTFEVLMASFGLDEDRALVRLAAIVHVLDVGGEPVPEAQGLEAVIAGAHERHTDDDELLAEMSCVLDSLYAHFARESRKRV